MVKIAGIAVEPDYGPVTLESHNPRALRTMPNLPVPPVPFPTRDQLLLDPYSHLIPVQEFLSGNVPLPVKDVATSSFIPKKFPVISSELCWSLLEFKQLGVALAEDDCEARVTDNSSFYLEEDENQAVYLVVQIDTHIKEPRARHWGIRWVTNHVSPNRDPAARCLEIITDIDCRHLINWGPHTHPSQYRTSNQIATFKLGDFTKAERQMMEAIAWQIPVQLPPDGEYNCQNWAAAFFSIAVGYRLLELDDVNRIMGQALQIHIPSEHSGNRFLVR